MNKIFIFFCCSLCLLWLVLLRLSNSRYFSVLGQETPWILNIISDHLCWCIKNNDFNAFNSCYVVYSIRESFYKYLKTLEFLKTSVNPFLRLLKYKPEFLINCSAWIPLVKLEFLEILQPFSEAGTKGVSYKICS